jgi:hypothetical protein
MGPGTNGATAGTSSTVTVLSGTTFALPAYSGTLPTLPFTPVFTAGTLFGGQNAAVDAGTVSGTTATATTVTLAPQTVDGTVAAVGSSVRFNGLLFEDAGVLKMVGGGAMNGPGQPPPQKHG